MWKDFFYFTKREKQGIIILTVLIIGILIGKYIFYKSGTIEPEPKLIEQNNDTTRKEISHQYHSENRYPTKKNYITKKLHVFDPNTADSITLINLGIKPYIARNIIKYRTKGGRFRTPRDLSKIYGISPDQVAELEPFVSINTKQISTSAHNKTEKQIENINKFSNNEPLYKKSEKYASGILVDINLADTVELKKIPGIGQSFAIRILNYRKLLGGYYSIEQIREVYGIEEEIYLNVSQWMKAENPVLNMIPVNKSSIERLKAHPYINFYQAKAILELKKKKRKLSSITELSLLEEFSEHDLNRLKYYLSFEN